MYDENDKTKLQNIMDDMKHDMAILFDELEKIPRIKVSGRRARVITIKLDKTFKAFRKLSYEMGLK